MLLGTFKGRIPKFNPNQVDNPFDNMNDTPNNVIQFPPIKTLKDLKTRIYNNIHIPIHRQKLSFFNKESQEFIEETDDNISLLELQKKTDWWVRINFHPKKDKNDLLLVSPPIATDTVTSLLTNPMTSPVVATTKTTEIDVRPVQQIQQRR